NWQWKSCQRHCFNDGFCSECLLVRLSASDNTSVARCTQCHCYSPFKGDRCEIRTGESYESGVVSTSKAMAVILPLMALLVLIAVGLVLYHRHRHLRGRSREHRIIYNEERVDMDSASVANEA
ncbi:hypothetical protein BOX15_Mlig025117g1, partial [Macrostomum lignano]